MAVLVCFCMVCNRRIWTVFGSNSLHFGAYFTYYSVKTLILNVFGEKELQMSKIAKRWQITELKSVMIDGTHKVDLSHNDKKDKWYITVKGEFYTEFTFDYQLEAENMYDVLVNCKSIFMDSLLVATKNRMSNAEVLAYAEGT
jgi:hypothetical protein